MGFAFIAILTVASVSLMTLMLAADCREHRRHVNKVNARVELPRIKACNSCGRKTKFGHVEDHRLVGSCPDCYWDAEREGE